jgi:hypothetical protein
VDRTAEAYFRNKFSKLGVSKTELNEYISTAVRSFERGPKRAFEDAWDSERIIKVGPNKLTNPAAGFKRGNFALTGYVSPVLHDVEFSEFFSLLENNLKSFSALGSPKSKIA